VQELRGASTSTRFGGSTEAWRHDENQVTQLGIGGDFHVDRVQGRLMTQFGQLATTTPRNDASPARGQWQLDNMYRHISETYGGYTSAICTAASTSRPASS
jgi:hypothetical protein